MILSKNMPMNIHEKGKQLINGVHSVSNLAQIHPNAKVGKNVHISPFVFIDDDVVVGDDTWIGPNVSVFSGTRIGKNCKIFPGAVIGAVPQDLKFEGEYTTVEIGEGTVIRECVTINRGTSYAWKTVVGKYCLIMAYVHIAHDCILGDNIILANAVQLAGHINLGDYVFIGGTSAVHQFVNLKIKCIGRIHVL